MSRLEIVTAQTLVESNKNFAGVESELSVLWNKSWLQLLPNPFPCRFRGGHFGGKDLIYLSSPGSTIPLYLSIVSGLDDPLRCASRFGSREAGSLKT